MHEEQMRNKMLLTPEVSVYTLTRDMARPSMPEHLRRSKMLPLRLTPSEWVTVEEASRRLGVSVADIFRDGAMLYIQRKGKDGSRKRKEKNKR